jgi:hypothetical protein
MDAVETIVAVETNAIFVVKGVICITQAAGASFFPNSRR